MSSPASAPPLASAVQPAYAAIAVRAAAAAQVFVTDPARPVLAEEDVHHLGRVLRLRPGEEVIAADGLGRWARAAWRGGADLEPCATGAGPGGDGAVQFEPRPEPPLTVAFAPVKGERPEWVVQKLTELGIDRIVPLLSERSVVRWTGARGEATVERLRRVAREASAQCRRVWLPDVSDTVRFADLGGLGGAGEVVLAQLSGDRPTVSRARGGGRARRWVELRGARLRAPHGGVRPERAASRDRRRHRRGAARLPAYGHRRRSGRVARDRRGTGVTR